MVWENSRFEQRMKAALESDLGQSEGEVTFGYYTGARDLLLGDVLEEIRGADPHLTDHGPRHIRNVLDNVDRLLGDDGNHFKAIELYLLGLCVLLHDAGNLDGREGHNQRIAKYYDVARPGNPQRHAPEKRLVVSAAKAHSGRSENGSLDTLDDVPEIAYLNGEQIRLRQIAAVVRFADELAEGPQRTSILLLSEGKHSVDSTIYHQYASVTQVAIDRSLRRISLTYVIHLGTLSDDAETAIARLAKLLDFVSKRIQKLDTERKYARYYCPDLLIPFGMTSVSISIMDDCNEVDFIAEQFSLSDKVIPSEGEPTVESTHFDVERVVGKVSDLLLTSSS